MAEFGARGASGGGTGISLGGSGLVAPYWVRLVRLGSTISGYISPDGVAWTLLTSRETTNTTAENYVMETIPVLPSVQGMAFRYFKVQVDDPGIPTDPAYPGLSSFGEMRIHGVRGEVS